MFHGAQGPVRWLESSSHRIQDVLQVCPELVTRKHLVVTAFDSSRLEPVPSERLLGWRVAGSALHVPPLESLELIPKNVFNEWYVFSEAPSDRKLESFANTGLTLGPALGGSQTASPWDLKRIQRNFWQQFQSAGAETYLSGGRRLIFATRDQACFSAVLRSFSDPGRIKTGST